jgi:hypothetical protein
MILWLIFWQHHCGFHPESKLFGRFYISSKSSTAEEMATLRGFQAISENDIGKLHRCIDFGMSMFSSNHGIGPLEFAAVVASRTFFTALLEQGICSSSHSIASPLHFATAYGRADMVEFFVLRGLDP